MALVFMGKPHAWMILACALLLPLSACDDSASIGTPDRSGAPRGTFSNAHSVIGNSAPERGELERLRHAAPASSGGAPAVGSASPNVAAERDPQSDTLTGRPTTP